MNKPQYVIAIGASAGGLEEINSFFDHTPIDGVSYVIVQHLSTSFKSRMVEVLAKHSKLEVEEAVNGKLVESNHVYLIPNDKYMTIENNTLFLQDKVKERGAHFTIDLFFESLAADAGRKSIGIILSGLGNDGSDGLIAIKNAGGMNMARNPDNSSYPSMPSKAIATGMVDLVLEPAAMPGAIEDYIIQQGFLQAETHDDEISLKGIIELVRQRSPFDFSDYKLSTILRRTKRRAAYQNINTLAKYLVFLESSNEEVEALSREFLISVTSFFRDKEAFEYIQNNVLPQILSNLAPGEELKIWVAGCATGEEVYSLAMLISEQLNEDLDHVIVKIFATDIDSAALVYAGKGSYPIETVKDISPERLKRFFIKEGNQYQVNPVLRKMAIFAQHDLVKNPPYCNMHLITCRNLLIYMAPILQKKIFSMLLFGLKRDGYLFLGSSENPMPIIQNLAVVNKQYKIYKNIKSARTVSFDAFSMPNSFEIKNKSAFTGHQENSNNPLLPLSELMHQSFAENLDYLIVCIDENNEVIKSYGNTSKYLLAKHFETNLENLLPKKLVMAFLTLSNNVFKTNVKETLKGLKVKNSDLVLIVNMTVSPLLVDSNAQKLLMVTLIEERSFISTPKDIADFDEKGFHDQYTVNLENELKDAKETLNSLYQQLDASNENMQSFNEEMISANEEMQSTNEEMQSVNEELDTINSEYQLKNKELLVINDDLNNYFRSNVNGQLFINDELQLMKFSPGTVKQINLLESDIGRPLSNITTNIKFETMIEDIKQVLENGKVITKEIETNNEKWYQVMTMPYLRQSDQKISGAIITFNDITELKDIQQELDINKKMLGMSIHAAELGTFSIHAKTRVLQTSERLNEIFGLKSAKEHSIEDIVSIIEEGYRHRFNEAIEATINKGEKYDLEVPFLDARDNKFHWARIIGNLSYESDNKPAFFTGIVNEITMHKQDELRKNDFIAMVSHDLKSPLTSIQAYLQLITMKAKATEDPIILSSLARVNASIKKMTRMINGFLTISGIGEGQINLELEEFEMNKLLIEIVEESQFINSGNEIVFTPGTELFLVADRDKIGQVITNLLSNAIKYSGGSRHIQVFLKEDKGMAEVCVKDDGIGIKGLDKTKIFDRYYRVKNTDTKMIAGFGLGLYMASEIIKRHNGKMWVESEPNKGSLFYFSLPLIQA